MDTQTASETSSTDPNLSPLEQRLGYQFSYPALLARALCHRSHSNVHNERLEFLGDSVFGLVISGYLYQHFPAATEGELTAMRSVLVCRNGLVEVAERLDIEPYILLGASARYSGNNMACSLLADTLEAIFGAVYLDGGYDAAQALILRLFAEPLARTAPDCAKDPKTSLQELMQRDGLGLPQYRVMGREGPDHHPQFQVECTLPGLNIRARAKGPSRRAAEQDAAAQVLDELVNV